MSDTPAREVWLLSDGRPGHYNQARGVVRSLETLGPVALTWIDVRLRAGWMKRLLTVYLNSGAYTPAGLLAAAYHLEPLPETPPQVIVSAGGNTSFSNVALARRYGCHNLFVGSLRGLSDRLFSAVLTLESVAGAQNNLVMQLAPTLIDPNQVRAAGERYRRETGLGDTPLWAMVIGGDGAGYRFGRDDWHTLAGAMTTLARNHGIRWLITTSRRTGKRAERTLMEQLPEAVLADTVWWDSAPRKVMQAFLGAAEAVFVTEESTSMVTEGISAAKPVITLAPKVAVPEPRYEAHLIRWAADGLLHRLSMTELAEAPLAERLAQLTPLDTAPFRTLAPQIARFLGEGGG